MKIGKYSFSRKIPWRGPNYYSFQRDVKIGRRIICRYSDDSDDGTGRLEWHRTENPAKDADTMRLPKEFEDFAVSSIPKEILDRDPEENDKLHIFFDELSRWDRFEKALKRLFKRHPTANMGYIMDVDGEEFLYGVREVDSEDSEDDLVAEILYMFGYERFYVTTKENAFTFDSFPIMERVIPVGEEDIVSQESK